MSGAGGTHFICTYTQARMARVAATAVTCVCVVVLVSVCVGVWGYVATLAHERVQVARTHIVCHADYAAARIRHGQRP